MVMSKEDVVAALAVARKSKRGFVQGVDLVVPMVSLDLKKPDHQVDFFIEVPSGIGKKVKVCALVGPELQPEAKSACDGLVVQEDFPNYGKNKKLAKKLVKQYDYFIGQANIMPQIAATFGRVLGPKGKMPNPKAGCIVPPKAILKPLVDRLQKTVHVSAKTVPMVQCKVGNESMADDAIATNVIAIFNQLVHSLPSGEQNIKGTFIKLTMGTPVKIGSIAKDAVTAAKTARSSTKK